MSVTASRSSKPRGLRALGSPVDGFGVEILVGVLDGDVEDL
jgi:hypothetical protein